jgi:hypothetical protein
VEHWLFNLGICLGRLVRPFFAVRNAEIRKMRRLSTLLSPEGTVASLTSFIWTRTSTARRR